MKLLFIFTGKTEPDWLREGLTDYLTRLNHYADTEVIVLGASRNTGRADPSLQNRAEAELQLARITKSDFLVILDERGKEYTSPELASWIGKQLDSGKKRMVFLIGGPFGFGQAVYERADARFALSRGTLPHQLVRIVLAEQVYRAFTILRGEKYHHS